MKSDNTSKSKKFEDMERNHKAVSTKRRNTHIRALN